MVPGAFAREGYSPGPIYRPGTPSVLDRGDAARGLLSIPFLLGTWVNRGKVSYLVTFSFSVSVVDISLTLTRANNGEREQFFLGLISQASDSAASDLGSLAAPRDGLCFMLSLALRRNLPLHLRRRPGILQRRRLLGRRSRPVQDLLESSEHHLVEVLRGQHVDVVAKGLRLR